VTPIGASNGARSGTRPATYEPCGDAGSPGGVTGDGRLSVPIRGRFASAGATGAGKATPVVTRAPSTSTLQVSSPTPLFASVRIPVACPPVDNSALPLAGLRLKCGGPSVVAETTSEIGPRLPHSSIASIAK